MFSYSLGRSRSLVLGSKVRERPSTAGVLHRRHEPSVSFRPARLLSRSPALGISLSSSLPALEAKAPGLGHFEPKRSVDSLCADHFHREFRSIFRRVFSIIACSRKGVGADACRSVFHGNCHDPTVTMIGSTRNRPPAKTMHRK